MELRLLGEVQLWAAGQLLDVGAPRLQAVLVALASDAGRPVTIETLIDRVWDDNPPAEVRNVLYSHLSRIRRLLRQASRAGETTVRIERRHAGYVLDIDPDLVDLHRFRCLADQGRDLQRSDDGRAAALAEALGLWRGPPLAGLPGQWIDHVRDSWHRQWLDTVVQWAQIELHLGHHAAVLATLPELVAEYPLAESLEGFAHARHVRGWPGAEALDRHTAIRQRLAHELGADPGPELRALHQAILGDGLTSPPLDPWSPRRGSWRARRNSRRTHPVSPAVTHNCIWFDYSSVTALNLTAGGMALTCQQAYPLRLSSAWAAWSQDGSLRLWIAVAVAHYTLRPERRRPEACLAALTLPAIGG